MLGICKVLLVTDVLGLVYVAQASPLDAGERLGHMTASAILGVVAVALLAAVVKLFSLKEAATSQIADLVKESTAALQRVADAQENHSTVMAGHSMATRDFTEAVNRLRRHCMDKAG